MSGARPTSAPIAIADLAARVGGAPFTSRWFALDQTRIDAFAAATEDDNSFTSIRSQHDRRRSAARSRTAS
ncbi:MAG: hypothetical protein ABSF67_03285 [Roseiarcus sp.]